MTTPGISAPDGAYVVGSRYGQDVTAESAKALATGGARGAFGGAQNAFKTNGKSLSEQLLIINDHTAQLSEQAEAIAQMTARGMAVPFSQSGWYYPPKDLVTLRLVGIGAGAGGAAGEWNLGAGGRFGGGGGGGGGYSEIEITAAFLPKTGENFDPIRVDIYLAGNGGSGSEAPGGGGGNIIFGANLAKPYATFQGGVGGMTATNSNGGGGAGAAASSNLLASAATASVPQAVSRISLAVPLTPQWRSAPAVVVDRTISPTAAARAVSLAAAAQAGTAASPQQARAVKVARRNCTASRR